jgi:ribosomal protein S12 methylthiotransferase
VPDVAIRTTCVVGFPGETGEDFETLLAFLEEVQFDRAGAFAYSPQEGTRAATLADDVPEVVKRERLERVLELQREITIERAERHIGRMVHAIVDRAHDDGQAECRTLWQADEVDGATYVAADSRLQPGTIAEVRIDSVGEDGDFQASMSRIVSSVRRPNGAGRRQLPVATTIGSFGR